MDADERRFLAHLPKDEAGKPERVPVNFQPGVTEATGSVLVEMAMAGTIYEAGQRNACDV